MLTFHVHHQDAGNVFAENLQIRPDQGLSLGICFGCGRFANILFVGARGRRLQECPV